MKRQRLRAALKLMLLVALGFFVVVSLNQFNGHSDPGVTGSFQTEDLGHVDSGALVTFLWDDRPVIVYRRTSDEISKLQISAEAESPLADAESSQSRQPEFARNSLRSLVPEWYVAINQGTDFGCTIKLVDQESERYFTDTCRGSLYDLAGRVLKGQYATRNLSVPPYAIEGQVLTLGVSETRLK